MSYTKGPWRVEGNDIRCNPQEDDTGTFIAEMISSIAPNETKSNAHLIAAAPDLLEACQALLGCISDKEFEEHDDIGAQAHDPETCAVCLARNAIAKAEGRE